ncbi:MAG TPA: VWA domain-containing protein [Kofleriaceae bacterium]|nr:VWA domain-containing protein [Kofleriaceae bacterium]
MKWRTLLLLSASGMAASSVLVWTAIEPARGSRAAAPSVSAPAPARKVASAPDRSQFQAGRTLRMEGRLGHGVLPAATDSQTYLFADVSAAAGQRAATPAPLNLTIVMDRSGSMKGKRLTNAVAAARSALQRLRDGDVVSIVAYNTAADVVLAPTVVDASSRPLLSGRLDRLRAAGDTCISCGIDTGMRLLNQRSAMVSRILLLSDGEATAGVRDQRGFRSLAEDCRRMGASITTIGVDVDYNERIMAALARDSNGRHFFVQDPSGLPVIFDQEMESLASTVANGAELAIDLAPGVFAEQVYDRSSVTSGSQVVVPLGAFAAGDRKTVLLRLRVPRGRAGQRPVAAVRLRYQDLAEGKPGNLEGNLAARLTDDPSEVGPLDGLVSARVSSSETAAALEEANDLFRSGRGAEARKLVKDKAGVLAGRRVDARSATPTKRATELDASFERQEAALSDAESGFAQPPAPNSAAAGAADPAAAGAAGDEGSAGPARDQKARVRSNQKEAFDLGE